MRHPCCATLISWSLLYCQDLQLYLLQLVQALKYEDFDEICAGLDPRSLMLSVRSFNSADSFPSPEKAGHELSVEDR